jgi:hypothetical protein
MIRTIPFSPVNLLQLFIASRTLNTSYILSSLQQQNGPTCHTADQQVVVMAVAICCH